MELWTVETIDSEGRWPVGEYDSVEDSLICAHAHLEGWDSCIPALTTIITKEPRS